MMIQRLVLSVLLFGSYSILAIAGNRGNYQGQPGKGKDGATNSLEQAVEARRASNFVVGNSLVVIKVLPDDQNGNEHQKWVVRLASGQQIVAVYNSDMCPRVPVKEGDFLALAGQFIWTNRGGLIHWLHHDPRKNRPDGYVELNGTRYCDK